MTTMQSDLNVILPEIILAVYAMMALLGAVYTSKDGMAPLLTWTTAGLMAALAGWIATSSDGAAWTKFDVQMEVSGYHHNVAYDFLSLRPAIYAAGAGPSHFQNLRYRELTPGAAHAA